MTIEQDTTLLTLRRLVSLIWPTADGIQSDDDLVYSLNRRIVSRLASDWGKGLSSYSAAPFLENAHASAGWQDPRGPWDLVVALLSSLDERSLAREGQSFHELTEKKAETILAEVTIGDTILSHDARTGFQVLKQLIYDVLFSDTWEEPAIGWGWLDQKIQQRAGF